MQSFIFYAIIIMYEVALKIVLLYNCNQDTKNCDDTPDEGEAILL